VRPSEAPPEGRAPATRPLGPSGVPRAAAAGPSRPLSASEENRAALLTVTRRRATGLLVAVAAVFIVSSVFVHQQPWLAWIQAAAVASLVGGLADWFAVTALFRRPLGLPIPHTAIVVERKDRFAATIGNFVQESFLTPEAVSARIRSSGALLRGARWLADEGNAAELAGRAARGLVAAADLLHDEDMHEVVDALIRQRLDSIALAPVAGRALEELTRDGRHEPLLDMTLEGMSRYVHEHGAEMHRRLGVQSPWWLPGPVSSRMVGRLLARTETVLRDMANNRQHPLRQQLDSSLVKVAEQLQTDEALRLRGEALKAEFLAQPTVRDFAANVWGDLKNELRLQADRPGSELRARLTAMISGTGRRLADDPALIESAQRSLDTLISLLLTNFDDELVALVSSTIGRWDAVDTSRRLELLLGPDLQYIRINGTVVGGLAGLALHAVSSAIH
jgi:uncharacterized membrane-anchored protein YjiN (DUF445 family)